MGTDQPFNDTQRWIELRIPGADTRIVLFTPPGHEDRIGTFSNVTFVADNVTQTYEELLARRRGLHRSSQSRAVRELRDVSRSRRQHLPHLIEMTRGAPTFTRAGAEPP